MEINPGATPLTAQAYHGLTGAADVVLPQLLEWFRAPDDSRREASRWTQGWRKLASPA